MTVLVTALARARVLVGCLVALPVAALIAGCAAEQKSVVAKPETLLDTRCAECHPLARVTSAKKDRAEWEATVERMIGKGARLSEDEKKVLVDYLAAKQGP